MSLENRSQRCALGFLISWNGFKETVTKEKLRGSREQIILVPNQEALRDLTSRVYLELRRMAAKYMRKERSGDSLQATALVHEVFLRLVEVDNVSWQDRARFFAVSANMMRRILADRARANNMAKRGNGPVHVNFDDAPEIASDSRDREMVAIDDALNDPR